MRGNIFAVVVVGTLVALSPAVLVGDGSTFAADITPLFESLAVVGGVLLFVVAMGAFLRVTFSGGGF